MWIVSVLLLTLWMAGSLLDYTRFGLIHLLLVGAVVIEFLRRPAVRERFRITNRTTDGC
jgi:hypothetical protein